MPFGAMKALLLSASLLLVACRTPSDQGTMSALPVEVQRALLSLCQPCTFANYDDPWNPSDVLDGKPQRHLVRTTQIDSKWLVEYDHGGIGRHGHTVVFALVPF